MDEAGIGIRKRIKLGGASRSDYTGNNVGMPVVVTNCKGGISDVTENGELAYLVRVGDEKN